MTDLSQLDFLMFNNFIGTKNLNNFGVTEVRLVCITNDFLCMGNKKTLLSPVDQKPVVHSS